MEQRLSPSLTRSAGINLVAVYGIRRGHQEGGGPTCRSTWLGSRVFPQYRPRHPCTLAHKCRGARVNYSSRPAGFAACMFNASSAAWKASLLAKPADSASCTSSSTFWLDTAAAIRCVYPQQEGRELDAFALILVTLGTGF